MIKLAFCLGNIAAWFVPSKEKREQCRGRVIMFLCRGMVRRFMRDDVGVELKTLKYVRQRTLKRAVYLANDKYYIKIFRDVSPRQIAKFAFLVDYVRSHISVFVPPIIASSRYGMYACERVSGHQVSSLAQSVFLKHADRICAQVLGIIDELQSIDVNKIPDCTYFYAPMRGKGRAENSSATTNTARVLAHCDLNVSNIFVDDDMNVCAIIDWDTMYMATNPDTDRALFTNSVNIFLSK